VVEGKLGEHLARVAFSVSIRLQYEGLLSEEDMKRGIA
jgi:hypothetical protein